MCELSEIEKDIEKKGFWRGVIFAVSDMMRGHGDSVIAKDVLGSLGGDLHDACRESSEYDVRPLREAIVNLPFGSDADYENLRVASLDMDGRDSDHDDAYSFEIRGEYGDETLVISRFEDLDAAEAFIKENATLMVSGEKSDDD